MSDGTMLGKSEVRIVDELLVISLTELTLTVADVVEVEDSDDNFLADSSGKGC